MPEVQLVRWLLVIALALETMVLAYVLGWLAVDWWQDWRDRRWLRQRLRSGHD